MEIIVKEFRLGELFCGPGGLALGATTAEIADPEYRIIHKWANDYDLDTCHTYTRNICPTDAESVICGDVRKLDIDKLGAIDALAFGFPCNDISVVGEQKGFDGVFGPLYTYGVKVLKKYHLEAKAYQCEFKHLFEEVNCPAIVHLKQDDLYHYVILYKVKDGYFLVGDPAKGLIKMSYESFSKQFTGIIIMIDHVGMPITKRTNYTFQNFLKDHFKQHYQTIIKMMIKTIIISMLTMIFSYYYQLMSDSFSKYPIYQIVFISLGFTVLYVFKLLLDYLRRQQILELSRELNQEYALKTMQNLIYQDYDYMDGLEKGTLLSRSQNLFELSQYFIEFYHVIFIDSILMLFILIFILSIQFFLFLIVLLMMVIIFLLFYFYSKKLHIENKKILEQKEHLNDGLLEFQENYFQTIQFQVKKMMKNKLGYLYDTYFKNVYHHDEMTNIHQVQLEALIQIMIMAVLLLAIIINKKQQMTLGTVMLVYLLLSYMINPLMKISVFIAMHDELQNIFDRY